MQKASLKFELLSDHGNKVAEQFGLAWQMPDYLRELYLNTLKLDLTRFNGDDSWRLPIPARFIIDQDSIIRYAQADPDYTNRPEPSDTVAALQKLKAGSRG